MRIFSCICDHVLFFENTACTRCGRKAGWCEGCEAVVGLDLIGGGTSAEETERAVSQSQTQAAGGASSPGVAERSAYRCGPAGHTVYPCVNNHANRVCTHYIAAPDAFCSSCILNTAVPDLSVEGNAARWYRLEAAKRRMLYDLALIGIDPTDPTRGYAPPLAFAFMADSVKENDRWRPLTDGQKVFTGHADGLITINLRETDPVEREKARVRLGEPQRTLIGHFRHEVGHYIWDLLYRDNPRARGVFIGRFGDPENPAYADALKTYYRDGPPPDWQTDHISAYASMHPWEDWAETWNAYLDMIGTLDTRAAITGESIGHPTEFDIDRAISAYAEAGILFNEVNRNCGLPPLVPELFTDTVRAKLRFVHHAVPPLANKPEPLVPRAR